MKVSTRFGIKSVIHDNIHYFENCFEYLDENVIAGIAHKVGNSWIKDNIKITTELADELSAYLESH